MKKSLIFSIFAALLLPNMVMAAEEEIEHSINSAEHEMVTQTQSMAVFSTNNYKEGLFDLYAGQIQSTTLPSTAIDNSYTLPQAIFHPTYEIIFKKPLDITGVYMLHQGSGHSHKSMFKFYDSNNNLIVNSEWLPGYPSNIYRNIDAKQTKKVEVVLEDTRVNYLTELELFINPASLYSSVKNLQITNVKDTSVSIKWENPEDNMLTGNAVLVDGELIGNKDIKSALVINDLESDKEYSITITAIYGSVEVNTDINIRTKTDMTPPGNVTNLKAKQNFNSMVLTFDKPTDPDFSHVQIYRNGMLIADDIKELTFTDLTPLANSENSYRIASVDKNGNRSTGSTINGFFASTKITNLKAIAPDFTKVELSWSNPQYEGFEKVTIYRKNDDVPLMQRVASLFSVTDNYEPIFETNGTIFKDLTVKDNTTYNYKVAATVNGVETDPQFVEIRTPKISVVGSEIEKQGDDFVLKWENPTTGQIKVLISGALYKTVDASTKQLVIPGASMKYDAFGQPLIQLIPIDENGGEGTPTRPGNPNAGTIGKVEMPEEVKASNLLKISVGLLGVVGGFVLLGLVWAFMPKLLNLIRQAFLNKRGAS